MKPAPQTISVQSCLCLTGLKISEVNNLAMNFVKNLILADKMSQMVENKPFIEPLTVRSGRL